MDQSTLKIFALLLVLLLLIGCGESLRTYPADALLAKETMYDADGTLQKTTQYRYDADGNCIERLERSETRTVKYLYTYDDHGNRLQCEQYVNDDSAPTTRTCWEYDAQGRVRVQTVFGNHVAVYEYTDGLCCIYVYGHDGNVQGALQCVATRVLDAQGRTLEEASYAAEDGATLAQQPYERVTFAYDDEHGGRISAGSVLRDGESYERQYAYEAISDHTEQHIVYKVSRASKSEESRTTLTYDENGNLLQRTVINHNTGDEYRVDYEYYE